MILYCGISFITIKFSARRDFAPGRKEKNILREAENENKIQNCSAL